MIVNSIREKVKNYRSKTDLENNLNDRYRFFAEFYAEKFNKAEKNPYFIEMYMNVFSDIISKNPNFGDNEYFDAIALANIVERKTGNISDYSRISKKGFDEIADRSKELEIILKNS